MCSHNHIKIETHGHLKEKNIMSETFILCLQQWSILEQWTFAKPLNAGKNPGIRLPNVLSVSKNIMAKSPKFRH